MAVTDDRRFAYTLCEQQPSAWAWRVYDADGVVVSAGQAGSKTAAERAIAQVYDTPAAPPQSLRDAR